MQVHRQRGKANAGGSINRHYQFGKRSGTLCTAHDSAIPLLDKHPKGILTQVQKEICTRMFIAIVYKVIKKKKKLETSEWPSTAEWVALVPSYNRILHKGENE